MREQPAWPLGRNKCLKSVVRNNPGCQRGACFQLLPRTPSLSLPWAACCVASGSLSTCDQPLCDNLLHLASGKPQIHAIPTLACTHTSLPRGKEKTGRSSPQMLPLQPTWVPTGVLCFSPPVRGGRGVLRECPLGHNTWRHQITFCPCSSKYCIYFRIVP